MAKKQLRKRMKALRSGHSMAALGQRSAAITERLQTLPELIEAKSVALFWPMTDRGEVDLRALDTAMRASGKSIYYPFMTPSGQGSFKTGFEKTTSTDELIRSPQGFLQAAGKHPAQPGDIDVVLVPALAADTRGHRIGYGAGYYDATLSDVRPPARAFIVAYQFQMLAELPNEPHDQACDGVVTDQNVYRV